MKHKYHLVATIHETGEVFETIRSYTSLRRAFHYFACEVVKRFGCQYFTITCEKLEDLA